jgi:multiple sugar transport system permease protein
MHNRIAMPKPIGMSRKRFVVAFTGKRLSIVLFLLPAFSLLAFLFIYPLFYNLYVSTLDWTLRKPTYDFVGLENYIYSLTDPMFWTAARATLFWTLGSVVPQFIIGFGLALILRENVPFRGIFRTLLFLPWVCPGVVTGIMFRWLYNPELGFVNQALMGLGLTNTTVAWLSQPNTAIIAVTLANIWQGYAFSMFTMQSALSTVPHELEEAALMDGAGYWQRLRYVIIPYIRPVIITVILLGLIWTTNSFTLIYVMTQGGPIDMTTIAPVLIYKTAFVKLYFGRASAISVIIFVFMAVMSFVYLRAQNAEPETNS